MLGRLTRPLLGQSPGPAWAGGGAGVQQPGTVEAFITASAEFSRRGTQPGRDLRGRGAAAEHAARDHQSSGRGNVRGTWVETHYSWLARTFGYGLIWVVVLTFLFALTIVGLFLLVIPWGILTIWYLYRVIRGWLRLADRQPMPV